MELTTVDGKTLSYDGDLAKGTVMMIDGKPAPAGDYQATDDDGTTVALTLDDKGAVASIEDIAALSETEQEMAEALEAISETTTEAFEAQKKENDDLKKRLEVVEKFLAKDGKFSAHKSAKTAATAGKETEKKAWRK